MQAPTPAAPPCPPLSGQHRNSFAFTTITKRLPVILAKAVDDLTRTSYALGRDSATSSDDTVQAKREEAKQLLSQLGEIRYELQRDRKLKPIAADHDGDSEHWNRLLQTHFPDGTWLSTPWLVSECYMYRLVRGVFARSTHWRDHDPFARQKQEALQHSATTVNALVGRFHAILRDAATADDHMSATAFAELVNVSLWGNGTDLSLLPNLNAEQTASLQAAMTSEDAHHHTIANDLPALWELVAPLREARIDIILDNAGFELFCDLLLADWLVQSGRARVVHFHAKQIPWFVSDVIRADFDWTHRALRELECFTTLSHHDDLVAMLDRWQSHLSAGRWLLEADPFWTTPYAFWHLPSHAPSLWRALQQSSLCIYKGDLNYRKLVYDCMWRPDTPFHEAIGPLHTAPGAPPLVALRTCKADVVAGLAAGKAEALSLACPEWMVNGEYAVIQLSKP
ncbi:hypothetical protein SYNPS1DRAFT_14088 [Syncephalis pseudoplumigaleata]|uniref:Sugar phosphate phosphatase n=1 Tax=Syncephalis pseudoplumigaleata TaxID=1712513 RepID=A0A4P9Z2A6_9FUNG|nr:hypothetical protein SYNPS1DRAFT_14088 [Syncephalis pseudoplumigaleata]|eukprot:RKP26516.1 hypothetical protein SYNPS1DRAFT_14088 [Syncephalis pseudoplumigaleata]